MALKYNLDNDICIYIIVYISSLTTEKLETKSIQSFPAFSTFGDIVISITSEAEDVSDFCKSRSELIGIMPLLMQVIMEALLVQS